MSKSFAIIFVCFAFLGCPSLFADPTYTCEKGKLLASGWFFSEIKGGARLDSLDIEELNPEKVSREFLDDIWVELRCGEKTKLSALTIQFVKERGFKENHFKNYLTIYDSENSGFIFYFSQEGTLCELKICPTFNYFTLSSNHNPRMGSFSTGKSLALPCSVPEFESVFGKVDKKYSHVTI